MAQTTENFLPPLEKNGDLPPGIYRTSLREIRRRFSIGSWQRFAVAQRLQKIYRVSVGTDKLARFVVFGSFVSAKREPADVDVFLLMEDTFDMGRLTPVRPEFFSTMRRHRRILEQACSGCAVSQSSAAKNNL